MLAMAVSPCLSRKIRFQEGSGGLRRAQEDSQGTQGLHLVEGLGISMPGPFSAFPTKALEKLMTAQEGSGGIGKVQEVRRTLRAHEGSIGKVGLGASYFRSVLCMIALLRESSSDHVRFNQI